MEGKMQKSILFRLIGKGMDHRDLIGELTVHAIKAAMLGGVGKN